MQTVCNTYWDAGKGNLTAQNTRKPFGSRGTAPDPAEGTYSAPANPLVGGEGLAVPSQLEPPPPLSAFWPRLSYPHSKISSDAVASVKEVMFLSAIVCLFVCLLAGLRKNYTTNFHKIWMETCHMGKGSVRFLW